MPEAGRRLSFLHFTAVRKKKRCLRDSRKVVYFYQTLTTFVVFCLKISYLINFRQLAQTHDAGMGAYCQQLSTFHYAAMPKR